MDECLDLFILLGFLGFYIVDASIRPHTKENADGRGESKATVSFEMSINLHLCKGFFFQRLQLKHVPVDLVSCPPLSDLIP